MSSVPLKGEQRRCKNKKCRRLFRTTVDEVYCRDCAYRMTAGVKIKPWEKGIMTKLEKDPLVKETRAKLRMLLGRGDEFGK